MPAEPGSVDQQRREPPQDAKHRHMVVLAIGRPWGLTRHCWILVKLVLTLAAVPLATFALPALIGQAVAAQSTGSPGLGVATANNLVIAPSVAATLYTVIVGISVLKPWGRIRQRRPNPAGGRH
jgi:Na+-driven multidrug efflux pump